MTFDHITNKKEISKYEISFVARRGVEPLLPE